MKAILRIAAITASIVVIAPSLAWSAQQSIRVVVPVHDIQRGETIVDSDLTYATVPADRPLAGVVVSMAELDGKEARRYLQAGYTVSTDDVRLPILVTKGSTVTMTFEEPGITLTATGRATSEGGLGETVTIVNPVSYRQVSAIVTGPGTVRAGDAADDAPRQVAATTKP